MRTWLSVVRITALSSCAVSACLAAAPVQAADPSVRFDITAQDLPSALKQLAARAGRQIIFEPSKFVGTKPSPIHGDYTVEEGLRRLLTGTGITYEISHTGVIVVRPPAQSIAPSLPQSVVPALPPATATPIPERELPPKVVIVTADRRGLEMAFRAKLANVQFTDVVDRLNLRNFRTASVADSLQRVAGMQTSRNVISGEGIADSIRGLGPSFTSVTLNGLSLMVASDGDGFNYNTSREVDLNIFPSELFTGITVSKTARASQIEGGITGNVDLRPISPPAAPGRRLSYLYAQIYNSLSGRSSPKASVIASKSWDHWGVLAAWAGVAATYRSDYYYPQGWTDPNLQALTDDPPGANGGSNGFVIPTTVPAGYGYGLVTGTPVTLDYLLSLNPSLTADQLRSALLPRLGTHQYGIGKYDRNFGLLSLDGRPSDSLKLSLGVLGGVSHRRTINRFVSWTVRSSNSVIPINQTVDENNVVVSGTYIGATHSSGVQEWDETTWFYDITPDLAWKISDHWLFDARLGYNHSGFSRDHLTYLIALAPDLIDTVIFNNQGGVPSIKSSIDFANPDAGYTWYLPSAARVQKVHRSTTSKSAQIDLSYAAGTTEIHLGMAVDQNDRTVNNFDNSEAYSAYLTGVASPIPLHGVRPYLVEVTPDSFMSLLKGTPAIKSFVVPDINKVQAATNYESFRDNAPYALSAFGPSGAFSEQNTRAYGEYQGTFTLFGKPLTLNAGLRHTTTRQTVTGPTLNNGALDFKTYTITYARALPSLNAVLRVNDRVNLRAAASRTMTRANPSALLPGIVFDDPSAQFATKGNVTLKPYLANNVDIGVEYHPAKGVYMGGTLFRKRVTNFTLVHSEAVHLAELGRTVADLTTQQRLALDNNGGPTNAVIILTTPVNAEVPITLEGYELNWVQPLDRLVPGLGFTANYSNLSTTSSMASVHPADASHVSYNLAGYYEGKRLSLHLAYNYRSQFIVTSAPNRNLPVALIRQPRGQLDFSASYKTYLFGFRGEVTLDATNLNNAPIGQTFGYANAGDAQFNPGSNLVLGWRQNF